MRFPLLLIAGSVAIISACAPAPRDAPPAAPTYVKQGFGFNGCDGIPWSGQRRSVSLDAMRAWAASENAQGFTIHPRGLFGQILTGPFPTDCKSKASLSWPLYLAE